MRCLVHNVDTATNTQGIDVMGYRTVVILNNDFSYDWGNDTDLGKKIWASACNNKTAFEYGSVPECVHADTQTLMAIDGMLGKVLAQTSWHQNQTQEAMENELLNELADKLGYRVVQKSKKVSIENNKDIPAGELMSGVRLLQSITTIGLKEVVAFLKTPGYRQEIVYLRDDVSIEIYHKTVGKLRALNVNVGDVVGIVEELQALATQAIKAGNCELSEEIMQLALAEKIRNNDVYCD